VWGLTCAAAVLAFAGASGGAREAPAQTASRAITYGGEVAPILAARCGSCHAPGGDAPFSLATFDDVRRHASMIVAVIKSRFMPPWKPEPGFGEFEGTRRMSDTEIATITQWVAAGTPAGPPPAEAAGPTPALRLADSSGAWGTTAPDLVLQLPAYTLRADGLDVFRIFSVPVPIAGARYVRGLQFRSGSRAVHHANIRVDATGASRRLDDADPLPGYEGIIARSADFPDGHFLGWTPGQAAPVLSDALSWRLEGGSDLVVQLHLRPSGKAEEVAPVIGLYFGNGPPSRQPTVIRLGRQDLDVPAGASRHVVTDSFVLPVDAEVRAVQPHAHYRARSMDGWATLPDGSRRALIRITEWDMNWQDRYLYAAPFWLPAGTRLSLEYVFDNSEANPRNPDRPPTRAAWGWRSSDEMADLWVQVMTRTDADRARLRQAADLKMQTEDAVGSEVLLRREPNHVNLRNDAAGLYLALGQPAKALIHFSAVTKLQPGSAAAWFNEGVALEAAGRPGEARARYAQALTIDASYSAAHNNLATLLLKDGRVADARAGFERAVNTDPGNADARANLAVVLAGDGATDAALTQVALALEQKPDLLTRLTPVVWLLAAHPEPMARRPAAARRLAERIVAATGRRDPAALDALAGCQAAMGLFEDAVRLASEAESATSANQPALRQAIRERMALYRAGKVFTLTPP
jgi:Flp pilus assembly protein TadD/mono/diheme cytochrome c family protein